MTVLEPVELRTRGFDALVRSLGWVNAVRFIQQYEPSRFNYTAERDAILPELTGAQLIAQMKTKGPAARP
jgi:hypothetical protein